MRTLIDLGADINIEDQVVIHNFSPSFMGFDDKLGLQNPLYDRF